MATTQPECRYKQKCFRLNPAHFEEYAHQHLSQILATEDSNGKFTIPDDLSLFRDKIEQQLKLIKGIQSKNKRKDESNENEPSAKIQKKDNSAASSSATLSPLNSQKKEAAMKSNISDFFKERASKFKNKDPVEMQTQPKPQHKPNSFPNDEALEKAMKKFLPVIVERGKMAEKLKKAAPYNFFLTTITANPQTHNDPLSITFQELLDSSLGELESSVQFNFMVSIGWLIAQYTFAKVRHLPLQIFYGSDEEGLADINKKIPNVTSHKVKINTPFGCHHTKMMFFFYKDNSMRMVVSTANLYEEDWHNRVQGLWISEQLPALSEEISHTENGESVTNFRQDLIKYLTSYNLTSIQPIIARIRRTDFSKVNVFFVSSVPGSHDAGKAFFGHPRLSSLLSQHSAPIDDSCPIILQASSIGSLGPNPHTYLLGEIAQSFRKDSAPIGIRKQPMVKLVYPSLNNVLNSYDEAEGGGCLPYDGKVNDKQLWLKDHLCQWRASSRNCTRAMPHIKSYFRYSDRGLYWFLLTSANMSRSAWGSLNKSNSNLTSTIRINSYEAGVLFLPRFVINKERFPMSERNKSRDDEPIFKLPFDIPVVPYGAEDVPYTTEYLKSYLIKKYGGKSSTR